MEGRLRWWRATIGAAVALAAASVGLAGPSSAAPGPASAASELDRAAIEYVVRVDGVSRPEAIRRLAAQDEQAATAERLGRELGDRSAGAWIDRATGELVVNVRDDDAAAVVRAADARPEYVRYALSELEAHRARLDRAAKADGTGQVDSWYVDVRANRLVATVTGGADRVRAGDRETSRFLDLVREAGPMAQIRPSPGRAVPAAENVYAGRTVSNTAHVCSAGFAAKDALNFQYMITAAHCVWNDANININGSHFGARQYVDGGHDEAAVLNWYPAYWLQQPRVWNYSGSTTTQVTGYSDALVGSVVCKSGQTTGWTCGSIQQHNVPAKQMTYPDGQVGLIHGLTQANMCVNRGDSGGPVLAGSLAQGTTQSAVLYKADGTPWTGIGNSYCGSQVGKPNISYYQPVSGTLWRAGLSLVL
ncbi:S1 family peptidase [Micromonosporaceae bacterium B7E4]